MLPVRTSSGLALAFVLTACGTSSAERFPPPDPRTPVSVPKATPTGNATMVLGMQVGAPFPMTVGHVEALRAKATSMALEAIVSGETSQRALAEFAADASVPQRLRDAVATYQNRLTLQFASEAQMRNEVGRVLAAIALRNGVARISAVGLLRRSDSRAADLAVYGLDVASGQFVRAIRVITKPDVVSRNRVSRALCAVVFSYCSY